jgi:long-chain acyl-CoA synthetase
LADAVARIATNGRLRDIFTGGEILTPPLALALRRLLPDTVLSNIFGLTETGTCDFILGPDDAQRHPGAIGRPAPDVQYRLVDEQGQPIGDDRVGELQIATASIMNGYLGQPELTRTSFADGMFRTGDLARRHPDGVVEIVGRLKEMISRGANKVYPQEIEQALLTHPAVADALVAGIPDDLMGERIHAAVILAAGQSAGAAELRDWAAQRLDRFKLPDVIHFVNDLPLGRTGKTDRGQLRSRILSGG